MNLDEKRKRQRDSQRKYRLATLTAEQQRDFRERYRHRYPEKRSASNRVYRAVRSGRLVKTTHCQLCWDVSVPLQAHHPDYAQPLDVVWLCLPCHHFVDNHKLARKGA